MNLGTCRNEHQIWCTSFTAHSTWMMFLPKKCKLTNSPDYISILIECLCRWHRETIQFPPAVPEVVWVRKPMTSSPSRRRCLVMNRRPCRRKKSKESAWKSGKEYVTSPNFLPCTLIRQTTRQWRPDRKTETMHESEFQSFQKIFPLLVIWQICSCNFATMGLAWVVVVAQLICSRNIVRYD